MAKIVEQATAIVRVDGKSAEQQLQELNSKAKNLRKSMLDLKKSNDLAGYEKLQKELKLTQSEMRGLRRTSFELDKVLKNMSGATMSELQKAQRKLNTELKSTARNTEEWARKSKQLKLVNSEIRNARSEMSAFTATNRSFFSRMTDGFNKYFGIIGALAASLTGLTLGFKKTIEAFREYEKTLDELSALTGLVGADLDWLSERAKETSTSMLEGNIRVTASASEILEAYKLVGSAKPELLANKEALASVTEEAMILAEASGLALPDAVKYLTDTMNQFNAPAEEAREYIDALAAGSKFGAAAIPDISEAIVKFGVSASNANVSVQESVGLIELLGEKGIKGAEAGTKLNAMLNKINGAKGLPKEALNVLDRYGVSIEVITNKSIPLEDRLRELGKISGDSAAMIKVFGLENVNAAGAILGNIDRYAELTESIHAVGVASEQAAINTDNEASALEQAKNAAQLKAIELGERLNPVVRTSYNLFNKLATGLLNLIKWFERNAETVAFVSKTLLVLITTIGSYKAAMKVIEVIEKQAYKRMLLYNIGLKAKEAATNLARKATLLFSAAKAVLTGNITRATAAMKLFNTASKANVIGAVVAVVAAAVTAFIAFNNQLSEAEKLKRELKEAGDELRASGEAEIKVTNQYFEALKKTNPQSGERDRLMKAINDKYGTTLQNMEDEVAFQKQIAEAQEDVIKGMREKIELQVREQALTKLAEKRFQLQQEIADLEKAKEEEGAATLLDNVAAITSGGVTAEAVILTRLEERKKALDAVNKQQEEIEKSYQKLLGDSFKKPSVIEDPDPEDPDPEDPDPETPDSPVVDAAKKGLSELDRLSREAAENAKRLKRELMSLYERQVEEVTEKYADQIKLARAHENQLTEEGRAWGELRLQFEEQLAEELRRLEEAEFKRLSDDLDRRIEEEEKEIEEFQARRQEALKQFGLIEEKSGKNRELEELQEAFDQKLLTQEEFEAARLEITRRYAQEERKEFERNWNERTAIVQQGLADYQAITSTVSGAISAMKEKELQEAGDNEAKKKEIMKKYAIPEFMVKVSDIIANTAVAIMQAYAQLGPFGGSIAAAALGITGGIQLGIAQQELNKVRGYRTGLYPVETTEGRFNTRISGPPSTGEVNRPTLFVAGESGPEMIIDQPTYRNLQINYPGVIEDIMAARVPAMAKGSYPETPPSSSTSSAKTEKLEMILEKMEKRLNEPIKAHLVYREFEEFQEEVTTIRNNTSR